MSNLQNSIKNDACNPKYTHPDIKLDVDIPEEWVSLSYHNDVCPSFGINGLQIFVCDDATRDAEGFENKYSIINEEEYGTGDTILNTNDWSVVLSFVNGGDAKKNV
tara:strand:- start:285 stop:602 length:318 start_codon:yes stop_codon:yes gene_type:complete